MGFTVNMDAWRLGNQDYWKAQTQENWEAEKEQSRIRWEAENARAQAEAARRQTLFENDQADRADNFSTAERVAETLRGQEGTSESGVGRILQSVAAGEGLKPDAYRPPINSQNPTTNNVVTGPTAATDNIVSNTSRPQWVGDPRAVLQQIKGIKDPDERQAAMDSYRNYLNREAGGLAQPQPQAAPVAVQQGEPQALGLRSVSVASDEKGPQPPAERPQMTVQRNPQMDAYGVLLERSLRKGDMQTARIALEGYHSLRLESEMGAITSTVLSLKPEQRNDLAYRIFGNENTGLRGALLESHPDPNTGLMTLRVGEKRIQASPMDLATVVSGLFAMEKGKADVGYKAIASVDKSLADLAAHQNGLTVKMAELGNHAIESVARMTNDTAKTNSTVAANAALANKRNAPQVIQLQDKATGAIEAYDINSLPIDPATGRMGIPEGKQPVRAKTDPQVKLQLASKLVADGVVPDINAALLVVDRQFGDAPDVNAGIERARQLNQERGAKKVPLTEEQIVAAAAAKGYTPYQRTSGGLFGKPELLFENPHGDRKSASELGIK